MSDFEYKCLAGPSIISVANAGDRSKAVKEYEAIINREAEAGWEFHASDSFQTQNPPKRFTLNTPQVRTHKMLIFRRRKEAGVVGRSAA